MHRNGNLGGRYVEARALDADGLRPEEAAAVVSMFSRNRLISGAGSINLDPGARHE
jgi:hypothetical protein